MSITPVICPSTSFVLCFYTVCNILYHIYVFSFEKEATTYVQYRVARLEKHHLVLHHSVEAILKLSNVHFDAYLASAAAIIDLRVEPG
jgi:hypothetical protein